MFWVAVALLPGATACRQENLPGSGGGDDVTFSVVTGYDSSTRTSYSGAVSDGIVIGDANWISRFGSQ